MKLLGNRIQVVAERQSMVGRFHLPESLSGPNGGGPRVWRVLAVGPGRRTKIGTMVPISDLAPGDRIIAHSHFSGPTELPDGSLVVTADQVLAVLPRNGSAADSDPSGAGSADAAHPA